MACWFTVTSGETFDVLTRFTTSENKSTTSLKRAPTLQGSDDALILSHHHVLKERTLTLQIIDRGSLVDQAAGGSRKIKEDSPAWLGSQYLVAGIGYADTQAQWSPIVFWGRTGLDGLLLGTGYTARTGSAGQKQRLLPATVHRGSLDVHCVSRCQLRWKTCEFQAILHLSYGPTIFY
ncbi:unnamed protein product [Xylocopa violacea]|uniref:Uncharacterized protein n=1 Tax=Xylocopa violacea TaxID=135666 RepID=A0ABP1NY35_XYLVO